MYPALSEENYKVCNIVSNCIISIVEIVIIQKLVYYEYCKYLTSK